MLQNTINTVKSYLNPTTPNAKIVENTNLQQIHNTLKIQDEFLSTGQTLSVEFRITQLLRLKKAIKKYEPQILEALYKDLHKPNFEAYGTEIAMVYTEIDYFVKNLKQWASPKSVRSPLLNFKSKTELVPEPYGHVLLIGPWNYPFQLIGMPLIGAMGAGNVVAVKPSEMAPHTSAIVTQILTETFDSQYISVFEGDYTVSEKLLQHPFDYIFFTGSPAVGKVVYQAAAKNLTPVTLELGGKSPTIVHQSANIKLTAKRIMWGKLINAGQTCIAPDYILVHKSIKNELIAELQKNIETLYGKNPAESPDYCRIINAKHFNRLKNLLENQPVVNNNTLNINDLYISPTLVNEPADDTPLMQEEIFGPILPIKTFETDTEVIQYINSRPKPLALYIFSDNTAFNQLITQRTSSGGVCINDTLGHILTNAPFGGVGNSGIGGYHGKYSFLAFSHQKTIMQRSNLIDPPLRYAPYNKMPFNLVKKLLGKFL